MRNNDKKEEKVSCYSCGGNGYTNRTVCIGTVVTIMRNTCFRCSGTGKINKKGW